MRQAINKYNNNMCLSMIFRTAKAFISVKFCMLMVAYIRVVG